MGRRTVTDEERARRAARGAQFELIAVECTRARDAARSVGLYCSPEWWLNRACREELGAAPHALDDDRLPAAVRVAKRLAFQVEQFVAELPPPRKPLVAGHKEYIERHAALKNAMRCEVRRAPAKAANEVVPGKTLGEYVRERLRAKARAGPVPAMQVPETTNPAVGAAGFGSTRRSDLECRNVANTNTPAAAPQPAPLVGVFWSTFDLYGVKFAVLNSSKPDRCESAAEKILDDAERIQDYVEVDLVAGEDRALNNEVTSAAIGASRIMTLLGRSMSDAARRLRFEASGGDGHV